MPPNTRNAAYLASQARQLADCYSKMSIPPGVIGEQQMRELGMNAYLAVGHGSGRMNADVGDCWLLGNYIRRRAPDVLVGKGLTFDSGGIPSSHLKGWTR